MPALLPVPVPASVDTRARGNAQRARRRCNELAGAVSTGLLYGGAVTTAINLCYLVFCIGASITNHYLP